MYPIIWTLHCGTPVICFPVSGIPEAIKHNENGIICKKSDAISLAQVLIDFYEKKYTFAREKIA
ncbi:MAG: glycosyltransferase [Cytophagales bacterium]|nr:MAG: glycosyltransferase [Cytophagales bacterium]